MFNYIINEINFSLLMWIILFISAMSIGMSKTSIAGLTLFAIVILANIFGGKNSAGIILPIMTIADIYAVLYYRKHAEWKYIIPILSWALLGILAGLLIGNYISDKIFKIIIGVIVLVCIIILILQDFKKKELLIGDSWIFTAIIGLAGGFATMIGNASGPIIAIYLLSKKMKKKAFIGTMAWFFMIVNVIKIPLHIFIWKTITVKSFVTDLLMIPAITLGAILGILIIKKIPENIYRIIIISMTIVSSITLFVL